MNQKQLKEIIVSRSYGETRLAILEGRKITHIEKESVASNMNVGNIYSAKVTSFEKSLNAFFVDYGGNRPGFLPNKNTVSTLKVGDVILIQIERGERDAKGAAVTQDISIASANLVIMPHNKKAGGISTKLSDENRKKLRDTLDKLHAKNPEMGVIIRTSGIEKNLDEIEHDFDTLCSYWKIIHEESTKNSAPQLIYKDNDIITRLVKDHLRSDISKVTVDHKSTFESILEQIKVAKPQYAEHVKLHTSKVPLFTHYQVENDIDSIYSRTVILGSGASLVIQRTEAMTTIDVNSAKSNKAQDIEETAYKTNLEAAPEVARQIKLRNIGGLIVVDFIDMAKTEHKEEVEKVIAHNFVGDKAKIQILKISNFGILEISRQRLYPSIEESELEICPKCNGSGQIRNIESFANNILRKIEENSIHQQASIIQAQLPVDVCTYILNEKRLAILELEERQSVTINIIPNKWYEIPQFSIKRIQHEKTNMQKSHEIAIDNRAEQDIYIPENKKSQEPLLDSSKLNERSKKPKEKKVESSIGLFQKIWQNFFGETKKVEKKKPRPNSQNNRNRRRKPQQRRDFDNKTQNKQKTNNQGQRQERQRKSSTTRLHGTGQLRTNRRKPTQSKQTEEL
ncbi:MAG: Rne/Rng family ribonuclease [Pseudomonadota bacterium]|nr:Rne/Rng family ribonuclease [Pseudomonadota bacterium]